MKPIPIVFAGSSISKSEIQKYLPNAMVYPPIRRGDLYHLRELGNNVFLIIDGVFANQLAISPREVIDVVHDGSFVMGAASMGALRASECYPSGMKGIGLIYRLYKMGCLESDDEVAVATNPERDWEAISLPLINIRYSLSKAVRHGLIPQHKARNICQIAKETFFTDRTWRSIFGKLDYEDTVPLIKFCQQFDLKNKDANDSVRRLSELLYNQQLNGFHKDQGKAFQPPIRCFNHHKYLGYKLDEICLYLCKWLFGSGDYQKYIWNVVVGEVEFTMDQGSSSQRAFLLREKLPAVIKKLILSNSMPERIWSEIDFLGELNYEIMKWYSFHELSQLEKFRRIICDKFILSRVKDEVAIAHGVRDWNMLLENVVEDYLFDAIPIDWIENACEKIAYSRTFVSQNDSLSNSRDLLKNSNIIE